MSDKIERVWVKPGWPGRVCAYELNPVHPDGKLWIADDASNPGKAEPVEVELTSYVKFRLAIRALIEVPGPPESVESEALLRAGDESAFALDDSSKLVRRKK